ncbi:hypothetical protein SUGI_0594100 [Cryptomeria japonica]|uniref:putative methylesterase 11, chloroplastic n=1 Tax=Cryptomeria japonica TaxID=3369 RepID=UPI002414AE00|nr:putative methylesterase 11, chloroplastic [Cryptomeria japonica]GLJ30044.1 hypothetical protein SUGI_0594100 [Cryptomeria japonica]
MDPTNLKPVNPVFVNTRKAILDKLGDGGLQNKKHHFVLVHEGGHGAWCWYKTADLLQKSGHKASVFDLAGSGLHPTHPSKVSTFEEYLQPLLDVLQSIKHPDKVVLVGHGLGGMALAYASEIFSTKIAVAVYLAGLMLPGGLQLLKQEINKLEANKEDDNPIEFIWEQATTPTFLSKEACKETLYNMSPSQDIQLASTLLRPIPLAVQTAKVETSDKRYGCVSRVYIKTNADRACPVKAQEAMIKMNPPHRTLYLNCDHSPFFSASQELHHMLLGIGNTYDR